MNGYQRGAGGAGKVFGVRSAQRLPGEPLAPTMTRRRPDMAALLLSRSVATV